VKPPLHRVAEPGSVTPIDGSVSRRTTVGTADREAHHESDMDNLQKAPVEPRTGAEDPPEAVTQTAADDTDVAAWVEHTHRKLP
jgi:hypothetical protein